MPRRNHGRGQENRVYLQYPWIVKRQLPPSPIDEHEGETITVDFYVDPQAKKERPLPRTR